MLQCIQYGWSFPVQKKQKRSVCNKTLWFLALFSMLWLYRYNVVDIVKELADLTSKAWKMG